MGKRKGKIFLGENNNIELRRHEKKKKDIKLYKYIKTWIY